MSVIDWCYPGHRRSQGGLESHALSECLELIVILCLERQYPKQNSVIRLRSNILAPPELLGWLRKNDFGILPSVQSLRNCVRLVDLGDQQSLKSKTKESKMHLKAISL